MISMSPDLFYRDLGTFLLELISKPLKARELLFQRVNGGV